MQTPLRIHTGFALLLLGIVALGMALLHRAAPVDAQGRTLRALLTEAQQRLLDEPDLLITIQFQTPLYEDQHTILLGANAGDPYSTGIQEVGEDYVCLIQAIGTGTALRCTPFSSIVQIFYVGP